MSVASKGVAILGVFAADLVFRAKRLPQLGETVIGDHFSIGPGGKGSNQAIAAARLSAGAPVHLVTRIGADDFGALARERWREAGVSTQGVIVTQGASTGAAFIFVASEGGENAVLVQPGAAGELSAQDVRDHAHLIRASAVFVTQLEQPLAAAREGLAIARAAGLRAILNPAPAQPLSDDMIALCDLMTPNETEAGQLAGVEASDEAGARAAAEILRARGAREVVVTLGAKGALVAQESGATLVPAMAGVNVVDTTGAGDAFTAGLATALAEGRDLVAAARFASAVAGLAVQRHGAAAAMPSRAQVEAALRGA